LDNNTVSIINTATNKVTANVSVGSPLGVAFNPDGTKVYVANLDNNTVSVIDTATNTVTSTVSVGSEPYEVAVSPASKQVLPVAKFSAKPTSGKAPLNVAFTDNSTGAPTSWKWTFGDGKTSTDQNPTHKYTKVGEYTVSLTVNNAAGSNTITKSNYITVVAKPVAVFSAKPTAGTAPLNVQFTDKSTGSPASWSWNFGDKSTSTIQNPTHKYTKAGKYTVSLTVKNAAGSSIKTISNYITVKSK
jgi:YVTN family beta-propeller protein